MLVVVDFLVLTLANMLGSTATIADKAFIALVLTATAVSFKTLKIYHEIRNDIQLTKLTCYKNFGEGFVKVK